MNGRDYEKRTDMLVCDELGPKGGDMMQEFIESAGSTSLCSLVPPFKRCSEMEVKFINRMMGKPSEDWETQRNRLNRMKGSKMKPELSDWIHARLIILNKLISSRTEL